jgi:hypothetical protein
VLYAYEELLAAIVRALLALALGTIILGGCAASQKPDSGQQMSAQEERDRAACLGGAHGDATYDEKSFAACMTTRGYSEDKQYAGATTASVGGTKASTASPPGGAPGNAAPPNISGPAVAARENYDRAVADYQSCLLDHTANVSECEKQRAVVNAQAKVLFGSSGPGNTIVGVER